MAFYNSLYWGLPLTSGRTFWVASSTTYTVEGTSYSASDGNDGLDPRRALSTGNRAVVLATADVGDRIVLLPGTHSTAITMSKAGVSLLGIPGGPVSPAERGTRTHRYSAALSAVLTVSAARVEVAYLHIVPVASAAGIVCSTADDVNLHDLTFNMTTAEATDTFGVSFTGATARPLLSNFYAYVEGNQGPLVRCALSTAGLNGGEVRNGFVVLAGTSAWDDVIELATGVENFTIRDCDFTHSSGAIMTDVIDVTGNTEDHAVLVMRCFHQVAGDLTEATATSDICLANNYIATIQGGTGGTLSTG